MARRQGLWVLALTWLSFTFVLIQCRSVNNQAPLRGGGDDDARVDERRLFGQAGSSDHTPRNATIKLYPGSYDSHQRGSCSLELPAETLSFPPNICLSGDYYFHTNVALHQAPVCDDGIAPYMAIFQRRGCTGSRHMFDYGRTKLPACLDKNQWPLGRSDSDPPQKSWSHWSMMFYCSHLETAIMADGANEHWLARPPSITSSSNGHPKAGKFQVFASESQCEAGHSVKDESMEAGSYLNLPAYIDAGTGFVRVVEPAFCADGRRAQLALYKDVGCESHHHGGTHDHDAVVSDITDEEGHQCVDVSEYMAVAFSCTLGGKLPVAKRHAESDTAGNWSWWSLMLLAFLAISVLCLAVALFTGGLGGIPRPLVCAP